MHPQLLRCKPAITNRTLSHNALMHLISGGFSRRFEHCTFTDEVDLANVSLPNLIEFRHCTFKKLFKAPGAVFHMGLVLESCVLEESINLESARVHGDLVLQHSTFKPPAGFAEHKNVDLKPYHPPIQSRSARCSGLVVKGNLNADCLHVYGSLDLGHVEIHGAILMRGVRVGLNCKDHHFNGRLYVRQAYIDGDFELEPYIGPDLKSEDVQNSFINGTFSVGASLINGRLNIRGIHIAGCLHAITLHLKGRLLADCWEHPDEDLHFEPLRTIVGLPRDHNHRVINNRTSIDFSDVRVEEAVWLHGLQAEGGLDFENARIGGALELSTWPREISRRPTHVLPCHIGTDVSGESLVLKNAHIAANVVLDGIVTGGRIAAHNAHIGAAFLCRPRCYKMHPKAKAAGSAAAPSGAASADSPGAASGAAAAPPPDPWHLYRPHIGATPTQGKSLSLYGANVGSSVDLSGALLKGSVRMRYVKIDGGFVAQTWHGQDVSSKRMPANGHAQLPSVCTEIGFCWENQSAIEDGQSLYLYGAEIAGTFCVQNAWLWGCLSMELAHVKGSTILSGTRVAQALKNSSKNSHKEKDLDAYGNCIKGHYNYLDTAALQQLVQQKQQAADATQRGHGEPADASLTPETSAAPSTATVTNGPKNEPLDAVNVAAIRAKHYRAKCKEICTQQYLPSCIRQLEAKYDPFEISDKATRKNLESWLSTVLDIVLNMSEGNIQELAKTTGALNGRRLSVLLPSLVEIVQKTLVEIESVRLSKARIDNDVRLDGVQIACSLHAVSCHVLGNFVFAEPPTEPAEHSNFIETSHAVVEGLVNLDQAHIGGDLRLVDLRTYRIDLGNAHVGNLSLSLEQWQKYEAEANAPKTNRTIKLDLGGFEFSDITFESTHKKQEYQNITSRYRATPPQAKLSLREKWELFRGKLSRNFRFTMQERFFVGCLVFVIFIIGVLHQQKLIQESAQLLTAALILAALMSMPWMICVCRIVFRKLALWNPFFKDVGPHVALLSRARLNISTYTRVEDWLANQGDTQKADDVHHAMRRRELFTSNEDTPNLRWLWKWLYYLAAGSGTQTGRLLLAHLLLFTFSWLAVFSNPASVEHPATYVMPATVLTCSEHDQSVHCQHPEVLDKKASVHWPQHNGDAPGRPWGAAEIEEYNQRKPLISKAAASSPATPPAPDAAAVTATPATTVEDDERPWDHSDSFWVALNVQIPLLHFWARDEWEPAAKPGHIGTWLGTCECHMQYDTLAGLIQIFSYLTIPMIIASTTRNVKRRGS